MKNTEVSIVVPVYNVVPYLDQCVESLVNQNFKNIEIILVDDGSTDGSAAICDNWAISDNRVKVFHVDNSGVSNARNKGLNEASGNWICFVDADDWVEKDYVKNLVENAELNDSDIFIGGYTVDYSDYSQKESFFNYNEYSFRLDEKAILIASCFIHTKISSPGAVTNVGVPWAKIYKSSFLKNSGLLFVPGLERMQDTIFNLYAFDAAEKIDYKRLYNYHYRKNNSASTVGYRPDFSNTIVKVDAEIENFIITKQYYELEEARRCKTVSLINEMVKLQFANSRNKLSIFQKTKDINSILKIPVFADNIKNCKGVYLTSKNKVALFLMKHHLSFVLLAYKRFQVSLGKKRYFC